MTELTLEQGQAIEHIQKFLKDPESDFFLLAGYAGTGKTYCMQQLVKGTAGRLIFTAPTNKATKVLRDTLTSPGYKPECRTIYSLLGLKMEANGEIKELSAPEDPVDLKSYKAVVVDEGSMVNSALMKYIRQTAWDQNVKFIFMGDPAQLPPVNERSSPIWDSCQMVSELHRVMRHDNQILELVTRIRKIVDHPAPKIELLNNNANGEGVWRLTGPAYEDRILDTAAAGRFTIPNEAKAIAWRNATVDRLNGMIRKRIFDNAATTPWLQEDRIILLEPAMSLSDDQVIATTDDEGTLQRITVDEHPIWKEFKIYRLSVAMDDNRIIGLQVLHKDSERLFSQKAEEMAQRARENKRLWKDYWEFKESFHRIRHSYAITAHRSQGSTYQAAFVDWRDILANYNRPEAYRCLYVACSRPRKELYLN